MTNPPHSYQAGTVGITAPLMPVTAQVQTNPGPSGGSYENTPGWRVIIKNHGPGRVGLINVAGSNFQPTLPYPGLPTSDGINFNYQVLDPGQDTEYGIAPQAAAGTTSGGTGGLGPIFIAVFPLELEAPAVIDTNCIQLDNAPTLSY